MQRYRLPQNTKSMNKHTKSTFNIDSNLRLEKVECIFWATGNIAKWHTHVWGINICIVSKNTQSYMEKTFCFQLRLERALLKCKEIRCRSRKFDIHIQKPPQCITYCLHIETKLVFTTTENLEGPNLIAKTSDLLGLGIQISIPSITPTQISIPISDSL